MASFFSFPNPVNEKAARVVAAGVVAMVAVTLITQWPVLLFIVTLGFIGRCLAGPRLSPLGWAAQKLIAPRLGMPRFVPGPPKRFAQGIGAVLTSAASVLYLAGHEPAAWIALTLILIAASLEAFAGFCLGCWIFAHLQKWGLIPANVCEACTTVTFGSVPEKSAVERA
ncbi:DUF4395 domain-containing protein [Timonella sp. A28]|uniref:DUF4395 domain-containing protein n=1 Tax=Timonella sp. A28 TaxID=3442640 RepID=UPI003EBE4E73